MQTVSRMHAPTADRPAPCLSIVIPVLNEQDSIRRFLAATRPAVERALEAAGSTAGAEFVFIDDGSTDNTYALLSRMAAETGDIRVIRLSRNFGKEAALAAGIRHAAGDAVIPMDVDLQDPPDLLVEMVAKWRAGAHVVNARRVDRTSDTAVKRRTANGFYRLFNYLSEHPIPDNVGDFRLMDRRVVNTLNTLEEGFRFNKGLVSWVGYRTEEVQYVRPARNEGESKWRYWKLLQLAVDGIVSFSILPLRVWTAIGGVIALAAMFYALFLVAFWMISGNDVPGYTSTIVAVLFLGGLNLLGLGVMGEYVGRTANAVRRRPLYVIDEMEGF